MIYQRLLVSNVNRLVIITEAENPKTAVAEARAINLIVMLSPVNADLLERAAQANQIRPEAYAQELLEETIRDTLTARLERLAAADAKQKQGKGGS